ncbi:MAG TPA: methionyl-tRNA formyltransferase [bacterium]|nr:methionyl-tRNA formyltransferase [bacterium]
MTTPRLRAVFLGTPAFAVPSLRALLTAAEVVAVITQPDRPKGRGRRTVPPPVAVFARERGLRVLQPAKLRSPEVLQTLRELAPDIIVTVAYGKIIPKEILDIPRRGSINVHPSLLPKYRGASPIQAALRDGQRETGVTIMYQSMELDAGDIILQRTVPIDPNDTAQTLEEKLAQAGAEALVEALRLIAEDRAPRIPQDPSQATYVGKLSKEHGRIDWSSAAARLVDFIRAMNPWPSAYTWHRGQLLKIWKAAATTASGTPGTVVEKRGGEGFVVATGDGGLLVLEVQPEGRRRMSADEYARGARLQIGEVFGML